MYSMLWKFHVWWKHPKTGRKFCYPHRIQQTGAKVSFITMWAQYVQTDMPFPGHHPDLHLVGWNNVKIDVWTHSVSKWFMWFFFSSLFWFMWHLGKSLVLASFQIINSKTRHHLGHKKSDDQAIFPSLNLLLQGFGHCYQPVCNFPIQITRSICFLFFFCFVIFI